MNRSIIRLLFALLSQAVLASAAAPPNDNLANAEVLPGAFGTASGTNVEATKESGEPQHANISGSNSVWYQWTAPFTSTASIDTSGSNFDTLLGIYTGNSVANLTEIASNDEEFAAGGNGTSKVVFNAVAGTVYQIAVDGRFLDVAQGGTGNITLNYKQDAPEIVIEQPLGVDIADGGFRGFGGVLVGSSASLTFTIRNTGSLDLAGLAIFKDGPDASNFSVTAQPAPQVIPGGNTTFTVRFSPTTAGGKIAAIHIANNDLDESPFDIILAGTGTAPEIAVEQPVGRKISDSGSRAFGKVLVGSNADLTFTINNTGSSNLTGLNITKDGPDASDFKVTAQPAAPVIAGGSTTFTVRFAPDSVGRKTAAIHIASNDANESPFDITLTGTGTAPEIAVEQPVGKKISDSGSRAFGKVLVGSNADLTFTIKNTGSSDLVGLAIFKDGPNASNFTVIAPPAAAVIAGGTTTFTVRFAPTATGAKTAAIHIASNDANESPFDITLAGTGTAPEIAVEQPVGRKIADNGSRAFGKVLVGSNADLTFTIKNTGGSELAGLAIFKDGPNASNFTVIAQPAAVVIPGGTTTFTVRFAPTTTGAKIAAIHIANNDFNESPFDIILTGTGTAPEIAVEQPVGRKIADSGSRAFGKVLVGSNSDLTFTIKNTGGSELAGLNITKNGPDASDFKVTAQPAAPVIAGGSTTFTVRFAPDSVGSKTAAIHIASNDANESPFDITLAGTGTAPEIAVEQPGGRNIADNATKDFGSETVGERGAVKTFTIRNVGTSNLTGLTLTTTGDTESFIVKPFSKTSLAPGTSATFDVIFQPANRGAREAAIHIANNDTDENPFDITLTGIGTGPEFTVEQPDGKNIADNATKDFGSVTVGGSGTVKTFTIRNLGTANLTGLALTTTGDTENFIVKPFSRTSLAPGASTTFTVTFKPINHGAREAAIHIASNVAPGNPFDIKLTGLGIGPEIAVEQPAGKNIADNGNADFGSVFAWDDETVKTFTIRNVGTRNLTGLALTITKGCFFVTPLSKTSLAPGATTTFNVTFRPGCYGALESKLRISSNDWNESPFDITLTGMGISHTHNLIARKSASDILKTGALTSSQRDPDTSKIVITVDPANGLKYQTLVITKAPGTARQLRIVEVSPNLLDWYSGKSHTTVMRNDAAILKVRDNTPITAGAKRYIRLRSEPPATAE